jgi:hypothetical protein
LIIVIFSNSTTDARFVVVAIAEMLEPVNHHPRNDGDDDGSGQDLRIRQH